MINYRAEAPQLRAGMHLYCAKILAAPNICNPPHYYNLQLYLLAYTLQLSVWARWSTLASSSGPGSRYPGTLRVTRCTFWICVNIFLNIQIFLGCARSEPSSTNHFHLLPNVFCLHELSGN